jgi:CheY-like chemotaxis protein
MKDRPRILVAEDNAPDVYLLREALREHQADCDVQVFEEGAAALAHIFKCSRGEQQSPDLFILDLNLPKVDGRSLLRQLRCLAEFKSTPVIVWSSSQSPRDREEIARLGAQHHVLKPSSVKEFIELGRMIKALLAQAAVE